jgi:hypothetical protein
MFVKQCWPEDKGEKKRNKDMEGNERIEGSYKSDAVSVFSDPWRSV